MNVTTVGIGTRVKSEPVVQMAPVLANAIRWLCCP